MDKNPPPYTPVVIVGAGRSGTNMLRDALVRLPSFATWQCDEINPVWRRGNFFRPDDEMTADELTPSGKRAVRRSFARVLRENPGSRFVVEKTCANSLRLSYVDAALDHRARFVQIVRDGRDVVASAAKRWRGEIEVDGRSYVMAKARYAPLAELPLYAGAFVKARLRKLFGLSDRLTSWGPRYSGMEHDVGRPLDEICALQWKACVDRSDAYLATLPPHRSLRLEYERFVTDPEQNLRRIADFLGARPTDAEIAGAASAIDGRSVGKGLAQIDPVSRDRLEAIMLPTLVRHGYLDKTP